jgi:hypothetical protein
MPEEKPIIGAKHRWVFDPFLNAEPTSTRVVRRDCRWLRGKQA